MANNPIFSGFCPLIVEDSAGGSPPTPEAVHWDPGAYALMEYAQKSSSTYMPTNYDVENPGAHPNSIFYILQNDDWCKGLVFSLFLGDVSTGSGTWNFDELDNAFDTVAAINAKLADPTLVKKVMIKLNYKVTDITHATRLLPNWGDFRDVLGDYQAYETPASPLIDGSIVPRYAYLWGYLQGTVGKGYHYYLKNFRDGIGGNDLAGNPAATIRNLFDDMLDQVNTRYASHPVNKDIYAGCIDSESASLTALDLTIKADGASGTATERNAHFAGRLQAILNAKAIVGDKHLVGTDCNFDLTWVDDASGDPTTSYMFTYKIAPTASDWHIGRSLVSIYNFHDNFKGVLPIIAQLQPDQMDSKTHDEAAYWGWSTASPTAKGANNATGGDVAPVHNPPDGDHIFIRNTGYFEANYFIFQFNKQTANGDPDIAQDRFNSDDVIAWYRASAYANSPTGGYNATQPAYVV